MGGGGEDVARTPFLKDRPLNVQCALGPAAVLEDDIRAVWAMGKVHMTELRSLLGLSCDVCGSIGECGLCTDGRESNWR